jgi:DNA polymerase-3 subunit alpha
MDHGLPDQRKVFPRLVELAKRFDAPLVATNDCHYFRKEDAFAHDVLLCIGTGKTLDDPKRLKYAARSSITSPRGDVESLWRGAPGPRQIPSPSRNGPD